MTEKTISRLIFTILLIGTFYPLSLSFSKISAQSSDSTFSLITPYYGNQQIRSYFDHGGPDYDEDNAFIKYTGEKWEGNVGIENCTGFENCYDGHDGLDVDYFYVRVYSEDQNWGWAAYDPYDTYEVRAGVAVGPYILDYPPPEQ